MINSINICLGENCTDLNSLLIADGYETAPVQFNEHGVFYLDRHLLLESNGHNKGNISNFTSNFFEL
jgi:hypothetical protein